MNDLKVTKLKWFWSWQDENQEAWLEAMARGGLHLKDMKAFGRYVFEVGTPCYYAYRMDFDQSSGKDSEYFNLIRDAGWEHVMQIMGWQYWRKEAVDGKPAEIFSDNASKIKKYKRFLVSLSVPTPAMFIIILGLFKRFPGRHPQWVVVSTISIYAVYLLFLGINLVMITQRIRQLERTQRL